MKTVQLLSVIVICAAAIIGILCAFWYRGEWLREKESADRFKEAANAQIAILAENQKTYLEMKTEIDQIALFFRSSYRVEIERGAHADRTLSQIVIGYLKGERPAA